MTTEHVGTRGSRLIENTAQGTERIKGKKMMHITREQTTNKITLYRAVVIIDLVGGHIRVCGVNGAVVIGHLTHHATHVEIVSVVALIGVDTILDRVTAPRKNHKSNAERHHGGDDHGKKVPLKGTQLERRQVKGCP